MGSLPENRTITLVPGDPVPSALINEIEDNIIGHFRAPFSRTFRPVLIYAASSLFTETALGVSGSFPIVFQSPAGSTFAQFYIPFDSGDRVIGYQMEVHGDGAVDVSSNIKYKASLTAVAATDLGGWSETNVLATFHTNSSRLTSLTPFIPQILSDGNLLFGTIQSSNTGFQFGSVTVFFDRLP